jgi:hypothetical protein
MSRIMSLCMALVTVFERLVTLSSAVFSAQYMVAEAFQDTSSPQYQALAWAAYSDNTTLQSTMSDDELLEHCVLVLLYFATGGESWSDQTDLLTPSLNTCPWGRDDTSIPDY